MHGTDDDVHVVALDQLVHVVDGLGRFRFVVDLEVLDFAAAERAALLLHVQAKAVLDRGTERRVGTGVGQHQPDLDLRLRMRAACGDAERTGDERRGEHVTALLHAFLPWMTAPSHGAQ